MIVGLVSIVAVSVVSSLMMHGEALPQARVHQTFNDGSEYEIVPIRWPEMHKRSANAGYSVNFTAFGRTVQLLLHPTNGILAGADTPVYIAKTTNGSLQITQDKVKNFVWSLYEDLNTNTTLAVINDNGQKNITGIIGTFNLGIRPISEHHVNNVTKNRSSVHGISESDSEHYHMVFEIPKPSETVNDLAVSSKGPSRLKWSSPTPETAIPDTVYPEILVLVEHTLYEIFEGGVQDIVPYMVAFLYDVDLQFRKMPNLRTQYKLNIAGILIATDADAFEFVKKYKEGTHFKTDNILDFGKWLWQIDEFVSVDSYDVAVMMTRLMICGNKKGGGCASYEGIAHVGGACLKLKKWKTMYNLAIVRDDGTFTGGWKHFHEMRHLFGSSHGRDEAEQMYQFMKTNPKCLYNKPTPGVAVPKALPGMLVDADEQCRRIVGAGGGAYVINSDTCKHLQCYKADCPDIIETTRTPALAGTSCGPGKMCYEKECVVERELI